MDFPQPGRTGISWFRQLRPGLSLALAILLAVVIAFGAMAGTVAAAQNSLPNESLYPLKTLSENVLLALTPSAGARLTLTLDLIDRRLAEIAALQASGSPIPEGVVNRLDGELDQALLQAAGMDNPTLNHSLDEISARTQGQLHQMSTLVGQHPAPPALLNIQERLQEQAQVAEQGRSDPQEYRRMVQQLIQAPAGGPPAGQGSPQATPIIPGATGLPHNHGRGPAGPEGTPGPGKGHGK
jgi:hypothetical protein